MQANEAHRLADYERAISWIEQNVPGGGQLAAAALAQLRPEDCPALQAIHADAEIAWSVKGRYVKYLDWDGCSPVFHLQSQWAKLRQLLGPTGYRQMIETGRAYLVRDGKRTEVWCFERGQAGGMPLPGPDEDFA